MDIKDVSNDFSGFLQKLQQKADLAAKRRGQRVTEHPPAQHITANFLKNLVSSKVEPDTTKIPTTQIPPAYPPCYRRAADLRPMAISKMKLETRHRGRKTLIRICTYPDRVTAVTAIAEDEEGTAVLLQLFNQPDESIVPTKQILRPGVVCILKEPFFKCATDEEYSLRVDHVTDIIWLEETDDCIPLKWRRKKSALSQKSSAELRARGNEAVQKQKWSEAEQFYSLAISTAETADEKDLAHLNRSLSNLRLGRVDMALSDAELGSVNTPDSEKGLFRQARALYELQRFARCSETLEALLKSNADNAAAKEELKRVKERLMEERTGQYKFPRMYAQATQSPPIVDCATFSKPLEMRSSTVHGRGLFTTKRVTAGQLLLCEKAFAYSFADEDVHAHLSILVNLGRKQATLGGQGRLLTQTIQKLHHNAEALRLFSDLHHGDYKMPGIMERDGHLVVDSFWVERIRALNSFGAPRTSRAYLYETATPNIEPQKQAVAAHTTNGIWLIASRINHSCVGNCERSFIGDMLIVRATKDMKAGTEILFSYRQPIPIETYEEAQKHFDKWYFTCNCKLCVSRDATTETDLKRRKNLLFEFRRFVKAGRATEFSSAKHRLDQIKDTYPKSDTDMPIYLDLWEPCFDVAKILLAADKPADAIKMLVFSLETLGFSIVAYPPLGREEAPKLKVKQWGIVNKYTNHIFLHIYRAYRSVAPELCSAAKKYFEVSYSMVVGEAETAYDNYPELRECKCHGLGSLPC